MKTVDGATNYCVHLFRGEKDREKRLQSDCFGQDLGTREKMWEMASRMR